MAKLKSRQHQIPNGFVFSLPELNYKASSYSSFNAIVQSVEKAVRNNPELAAKNKWPTETHEIEEWVDRHNAAWCEANGWKDYYIATAPGGFMDVRPVKDWPLWAQFALSRKQPGEQGVGDTIHRMIGADTSAEFSAWYQRLFGKECGCKGRRAEWNLRYKYL